ncbi:MAG: septum formation initiator family protein [Actinophytocola sp.]|nr:septum formation initiator family protein [Actinophytocola sp.]
MASRGRSRDGKRPGGRSSGPSRRPRRVVGSGSARARLRASLHSKRMASAARTLGLSTTRRAAIAALVVCALAFTLAVPLRTYLSQRAEIAEQTERAEQLREQVAEFERRKAELSDPAQIEAEARRRLRYVLPGETPYIVQLPGDGVRGSGEGDGRGDGGSATWYEELWRSATEEPSSAG